MQAVAGADGEFKAVKDKMAQDSLAVDFYCRGTLLSSRSFSPLVSQFMFTYIRLGAQYLLSTLTSVLHVRRPCPHPTAPRPYAVQIITDLTKLDMRGHLPLQQRTV